MKQKIPYSKPSITSKEIAYASDAAANGWGEKCYDYINKFEVNFAEYLGVNYAVATSSCTGALTLEFAAMGIGPGDEVIMADTNWVATVSPIIHLGAKPVFIDISSDTWCIDEKLIESKINKNTKAIIATHLYGSLCEMDNIVAIAKRYGLTVIEDSAEAIGAVYRGRKAGSIGRFGTFSFHGTKTITTGEGGMFVTNNEELYHKVLVLNSHGRGLQQKKQFWADEIGFKFKMSNVQAAIGCAQLERVEELTKRKLDILHMYKELTSMIPNLHMNSEPAGTVNGAWMPTVVFKEGSGITRKELQQVFFDENIDARAFFWPLSALPMFKPVPENVNAFSIPERAINLPSFHDITESEQLRIIAALKSLTS